MVFKGSTKAGYLSRIEPVGHTWIPCNLDQRRTQWIDQCNTMLTSAGLGCLEDLTILTGAVPR
jgi:hypothetical protein